MNETLRRSLTIVATTGTGVTGGILLAFSTIVGPALRRLQAQQAITAMQVINDRAPVPYVLVGVLGGGLPAAIVALEALVSGDLGGSSWRLIGGLLSVASVAITIGYHIPRNDHLGRLAADSIAAAEHWTDYLGGWLRWNHVRTAASIAGAACLALGVPSG